MEFIKQLVEFEKRSIGNLTPNAIAIYLHLFMANNRNGWEEWFSESDYWIGQAVGIKRHETIVAAINLLKQRGFIDFERGSARNRASSYKIIPLVDNSTKVLNNSTKHSIKHSTKPSIEPSTKHSIEPSTKHSTKDGNPLINSKEKTKTIERDRARAREEKIVDEKSVDKGTRFSPPSLSEIESFIREKGYQVDASTFHAYYTATDWHDMNGNPVRSWRGKVVTWASHERERKKRDPAEVAIAMVEGEENE